MLDGFGRAFRGVIALGLAAFWGVCAYVVQVNGAPAPAVYGIAILALITGAGGLFQLIRGLQGSGAGRKPPGAGFADPAEAEPTFDSEAALARYLERKQAEPRAEWASGPAAVAARPGFGRKQS